MADEATLKDTLVTDPPAEPKAESKEPDAAKAAADIAAKAANDEALAIGRTLIESGITKEKVNDLLAAPQALESLRYLINNNPQEFLNLIERSNPATGEKLLETMADVYVQRYKPREPQKGADGKPIEGAPPELMAEVEALRSEVTNFRTEREQAAARASMAQIQQRYDGRVDELFNQLPKDIGLTKAETKALRAQLNAELATDPESVKRVNNGNFVDVPRRFQSIIEGWARDRKAAADTVKAARDRAAAGASMDILGGPQPFVPDFPAGFADSWDGTEDAFAAALTKASGGAA